MVVYLSLVVQGDRGRGRGHVLNGACLFPLYMHVSSKNRVAEFNFLHGHLQDRIIQGRKLEESSYK